MFRVLFLMLLVLIALIAGPYIANTHDLVRIETNTKIINFTRDVLCGCNGGDLPH